MHCFEMKKPCCSDFRYESNGIFVLGWVFFFRQISTIFDRIFLYHSKGIVVLSLNLKRYFTCDHFLKSYGGLKIAILANLGQLTRDIFRALISALKLPAAC